MRSKAVTTYLTSPLLAAALAIAPVQAIGAPTTTTTPTKTAPAKTTTTPAKTTTPTKTVPTETPTEAAPVEGEEPPVESDTDGATPEGDTDGATPEETAGEEEVVPDEPPPEVTEPPPPEPTPQVEQPDPMADKPEEPTIGGKPRKGIGLMIAGGAVLLGGITSTITFAMVTENCSREGPLACKHQNQGQFLIPLGAAISLLGVMLLSVGVGYHLHYRKWQRWTPADGEKAKRRERRRGATASLPSPTLMHQGGGLSVSGRF